MILGILGHPQTAALGRLMDDDGRPNKPVIEKLVFYLIFVTFSKISSLYYHFLCVPMQAVS